MTGHDESFGAIKMTTTAQYKAALYGDVVQATIDRASGTAVHAVAPNGDDLTFKGKGLTFDSHGVSGGTVTGIDAHVHGYGAPT